jgi:Double zinc ribbon
MRCPRCDADTPDGTKFCIECGASLTPRCPRCGADILPRAKFCGECGTPLTASNPAPPFMPPPSPLRYTPGYLAEKILTSKAALEGERKQVTVLFADLKGSMELVADRDPEEARRLLDPVLERMMAAVHRYEGTVNQVMGDGIRPCSGHRSRMKTTPCGRATRRWPCRRPCATTATRCAGRTASKSAFG